MQRDNLKEHRALAFSEPVLQYASHCNATPSFGEHRCALPKLECPMKAQQTGPPQKLEVTATAFRVCLLYHQLAVEWVAPRGRPIA